MPSAHEIKEIRDSRAADKDVREWKQRIDVVEALYRGDWEVVFPDETVSRGLPNIANLVHDGIDDMSRLASSSQPVLRSEPESNDESVKEDARVREAAMWSYWTASRGDLLVPKFVMDLAGTGFAAVAAAPLKDKRLYPKPYRLDPRGCYPTIVNGELQDLICVTEMSLPEAERLFKREIATAFPRNKARVQVIDWYDRDVCMQVIVPIGEGGQVGPAQEIETSTFRHGWGQPLVGYAVLDSFDGKFRGIFDQTGGILNTRNRIYTLLLDYADQLVYPETIYRDVENPDDPPGPKTKRRLMSEVAMWAKVPPAGAAPDIYRLLDDTGREARNEASYPEQRQGAVSQTSNTSASFVNATQGQLTTLIEYLQNKVSSMREQWNSSAMYLDENYMNTSKPLLRPVGKVRHYTPKDRIKGRYWNRVSYGIGSGMDKYNQRVALIQAQTAGMISQELSMEQLEEVTDVPGERHKIEKELVKSIFIQKTLPTLDPMMLFEIMAAQAKGKSLEEAVIELQEKQAAAQAAAAQAAQAVPGVPGPVPEGVTAATQATAIEKGAVSAPPVAPEQELPDIELPPEALNMVMTRPVEQ